ncbi:MAG: DUF4013 domain-containing protein [Candidatus Nanohaloarchaeota archaeon QJJ-7]|nr:DUF4013 domain-containing protein [Candidatus Nanohaloarchaeota archaeon QJJ-7]
MAADKEDGIIDFSAQYPLERGWIHIAKGAVLVLFGVLIIPLFMLYGYILRVISAAAQDEDLPPIRDFVDLFVEGIKFFLVIIPYTVVIYVFIAGSIMVGIESQASTVILGGLYILAAYIGIMLVSTYAVTRDWRAAYSIDTLYRRTFNTDYLRLWLMFIVFYLLLYIAVIVITLISAITIIGPFIVLFAGSFYILLGISAFMGRMYAEAP